MILVYFLLTPTISAKRAWHKTFRNCNSENNWKEANIEIVHLKRNKHFGYKERSLSRCYSNKSFNRNVVIIFLCSTLSFKFWNGWKKRKKYERWSIFPQSYFLYKSDKSLSTAFKQTKGCASWFLFWTKGVCFVVSSFFKSLLGNSRRDCYENTREDFELRETDRVPAGTENQVKTMDNPLTSSSVRISPLWFTQSWNSNYLPVEKRSKPIDSTLFYLNLKGSGTRCIFCPQMYVSSVHIP